MWGVLVVFSEMIEIRFFFMLCGMGVGLFGVGGVLGVFRGDLGRIGRN